MRDKLFTCFIILNFPASSLSSPKKKEDYYWLRQILGQSTFVINVETTEATWGRAFLAIRKYKKKTKKQPTIKHKKTTVGCRCRWEKSAERERANLVLWWITNGFEVVCCCCCNCSVRKFLGQGTNQAAAVTYCGNTRSLTHWAKLGIKPVPPQKQHQILNLLCHSRNSWIWSAFKRFGYCAIFLWMESFDRTM